MSGRVIGSSSEEEEKDDVTTSTPFAFRRKKPTMQLNQFDASLIAPESDFSTLNCTVVPKSQEKHKFSNDKKYTERQRPVILYSSDDDEDEYNSKRESKSSSSSVQTILGTPSTEGYKTATSENSVPSRGSTRPSVDSLSHQPKTENIKQNKFQFKSKVQSTINVSSTADTLPLDCLVDQISQINLGNQQNGDDLADNFQSVVQIDDEDEDPAPRYPPSPDIVVFHHSTAPRRVEPPIPKVKNNLKPGSSSQQPRQAIFLSELPPTDPESQRPRQTILLPEPPIQFVPESIPFELRAGVGSLIGRLQKAIVAIPKDEDKLGSPERLTAELYAHQKYGLTWMWWRERVEPFGGILADEMGLGKTVMVLALICRGKEEASKENSGPSWTSADNRRLIPSKTTLVVCPPSVMGQWEEEIKKKSRGLKLYVYHGPSRTKSASLLSQHDVVLTTFNTLGSDIPKLSEQTAEACTSPLVRINWERVVLDEGHIIRNPKTCGAQAACRLKARHRWIVTGTPVHNKPSDMFSLVKFLQLHPFDDPKVWEVWIGMKSINRQNAERLNTIARALLLRRTKDEVMCGLQGTMEGIPEKTIIDVVVDLKEQEQELYDHLNQFAAKEFRDFLKSREQRNSELQQAANKFIAGGGRVKASEEKSFSHIFVLILRLRQCSVLPFLIHTMIDQDETDVDDDAEYDPVEDLVSMKNPVFSEDFKSAKLERMYADLRQLKKRCREAGGVMEKVVIVSQWTTLLNIISKHLDELGYSHVTISGEVKIGDRMDIMSKFNNHPSRPQIMLLSLAAGGVGLNLTGANHLFFLDIHWNPQLELQAQDRIHRFGQKKPVTIHRYISRNTMEERVVELQKTKLALADGILNSAQKRDGGGLGLGEMRQLFGI